MIARYVLRLDENGRERHQRPFPICRGSPAHAGAPFSGTRSGLVGFRNALAGFYRTIQVRIDAVNDFPEESRINTLRTPRKAKNFPKT